MLYTKIFISGSAFINLFPLPNQSDHRLDSNRSSMLSLWPSLHSVCISPDCALLCQYPASPTIVKPNLTNLFRICAHSSELIYRNWYRPIRSMFLILYMFMWLAWMLTVWIKDKAEFLPWIKSNLITVSKTQFCNHHGYGATSIIIGVYQKLRYLWSLSAGHLSLKMQ